MSKNLYDLREMLCEELDEYNRDAKNGLNERTLDTVHKLTDTIKNIDKIMMLEDGDYSRTGEWEADMRGHYSRGDDRERMISDIETMMQKATGTERDAYKRALDILNNM